MVSAKIKEAPTQNADNQHKEIEFAVTSVFSDRRRNGGFLDALDADGPG